MSITLKSAEDIAILRAGGKILATILDELEAMVAPGVSTLDIDDRAMELIDQYQVEPMTLGYKPQFADRPYPAATCVSINDEVVHGIPNEQPRILQAGDVVSIDVVVAHQGLVVDSARTVGVGDISAPARELLAVTRKALGAGIDAAQPGKRVGAIGAAIEAVVPKRFGLIEVFCGHGVGYDLHEEPTVPNFGRVSSGPLLEPGMVLAIEPMITLGSKEVEVLEDGYTAVTADGSIAAHMEHTILITEAGPEILTLR